MTIRILSFDFDGCLFHSKYILSTQKNVIASNKSFLDGLKEDNHLYSKNITLIGSNRQSKRADDVNAYRVERDHGLITVGSCFPAIQQISDYLGTELDTFLLADLYGNLPFGKSFERALQALKDKHVVIEHAKWLFDETKATVLYAQMQKMANDYPGEEIVFDFYDDRLDILNTLSTFYAKYPELIPPNVTLRLHQYKGDSVKMMAEIINPDKENGFIDENYPQTVRDMAKNAILLMPFQDGEKQPMQVADCVTPDLLKNRRPLKKAPLSSANKEKVASTAQGQIVQPASNPMGKIKVEDLRIIEGRTDEFSSQLDLELEDTLLDPRDNKELNTYSFFSCVKDSKGFQDAYTNIWEQDAWSSNKKRIKALLLDYTKENSLFGSLVGRIISGHWNRHHVDAVSEIIKNMSILDYYETSNDIIEDLKALKPVLGGSLSRRIEFIEEHLNKSRKYVF